MRPLRMKGWGSGQSAERSTPCGLRPLGEECRRRRHDLIQAGSATGLERQRRSVSDPDARRAGAALPAAHSGPGIR